MSTKEESLQLIQEIWNKITNNGVRQDKYSMALTIAMDSIKKDIKESYKEAI